MKQKQSNSAKSGGPTSTPSEESRKFGKLLDNSSSSEAETAEVKQFDWIPLKRGPFYAVGKTGAYTLTLCNQAVSATKFKTIEAAQKAVDEKGWDLIFVACAVYRDAWELANRPKKDK